MNAIATKDITDEQVVRAAAAFRDDRGPAGVRTIDGLMAATGAPYKVALRAIERACRRGLVDWGVCPDVAWPTPAGDAIVASPQPLVLREPTDAELADLKRAFAVQFGASYLLEVAAAEDDPTLTPERARELAAQALAEDGAP